MKNNTGSACEGRGPEHSLVPPPEIAATLAVLSGKWKILILWTLSRGTTRFNNLKRALPGVTQHTLTVQLRELEAEGIVHRELFAEVPLRVEYSLTEHGKTITSVLRSLASWGKTHLRLKERTSAAGVG